MKMLDFTPAFTKISNKLSLILQNPQAWIRWKNLESSMKIYVFQKDL